MSESSVKFGTNKLMKITLNIFYYIGMWPRKDSTIWYMIFGYLFHLMTSFGWTTAKCIGTLMLEKRNELILLGPTSLYGVVSLYRGFIIMWKFRAIEICLKTIFDFSLNEDEYKIIRKKIETFSRKASAYVVFIVLGMTSAVLNPFLTTERVMPIPIWVPFLDWKASERDYYIGLVFSNLGMGTMVFICGFTPIPVWYLLYSSSILLEVLGNRFKNLNYEEPNKQQSVDVLLKYIKLHEEIIGNIKRIENIFSSTFFLQIVTSALCICSVTYLMASESISENFNNFVMFGSLLGIYGYEISVLIYYANEIALWSDQLSFNVYESNWTILSAKNRKNCIIFLEQLKNPKEIVVGKVFPMRMKLLSSILNLAYSIFNILRKE